MPTHNEVAHAWAHKTGRKRNGFRMFYEDNTIYSYGRHFPIASHVTNARGEAAVLFTNRSYSVSTSKHKSIVLRACSHLNIIEVGIVQPVEYAGEHEKNYAAMVLAITGWLAKAKRARKYGPWHIRSAGHVLEQANAYAAFFDLDKPVLALESIDAEAAVILERVKAQEAVILERVKAQEAEAERQAQIRARERALKDRDRLRQWLKGEDVSPPHTFRPYVRVRGDVVQTTWGASVPLADALRVWEQMKACHATKNWTVTGGAVGDFKIDTITPHALKVGCHNIPYRFAELAARCAGLE